MSAPTRGLHQRCGRVARVNGQRVICGKSVEHRTSKVESRRAHYDADVELTWTTADEDKGAAL